VAATHDVAALVRAALNEDVLVPALAIIDAPPLPPAEQLWGLLTALYGGSGGLGQAADAPAAPGVCAICMETKPGLVGLTWVAAPAGAARVPGRPAPLFPAGGWGGILGRLWLRPPGATQACPHRYCVECATAWHAVCARAGGVTLATCPLCRRPFNRLLRLR
jgi:hypothetical protein